jgi:hypothetical protein
VLASLCCLIALSAAAQDRPQGVMMPMAELLKQLDRTGEYVLMPLQRYRELLAAAMDPGSHPPRPSADAPAWLETAVITGTLENDSVLRLQADAEAVSVSSMPSLCAVFLAAPDWLGAAEIDGKPALFTRRDSGLMLLLPMAGRYRVHLTWECRLETRESDRQGALPLPLAAGIDLSLVSATTGSLIADALAEDASGAQRSWHLARNVGPVLPLRWLPGLSKGDDLSVFGVEQALQVSIAPNQRLFHWSARLQPRRGAMPNELRLTPPPGWTFTTASAGILSIDGADELRMRIDPKAQEISCVGIMRDDAAIDLPRIAGAAYQNGIIIIETPLDMQAFYEVPSSWQSASAQKDKSQNFSRKLIVAAPGRSMSVTIAEAPPGASLSTDTELLISADTWLMRLSQRLTGDVRFRIPLRLPDGWSCQSLTVRAGELQVSVEIPPDFRGGEIPIEPPEHGVGEILVEAELTRAAIDTPQNVAIAALPGVQRQNHRIRILVAPDLDSDITPSLGWRLDRAADSAGSANSVEGANDALATALACVGEAQPIQVSVKPRALRADGEIVMYVMPSAALATAPDATPGAASWWCRIDARLRVRDHDITTVTVPLPLAAGTVQVDDPHVRAVAVAGGLELSFATPWHGERLLRIEGAMTRSDAPLSPNPAWSWKRYLAVQAPEHLHVDIDAGPRAQAIDDDTLPAWSHCVPNVPLLYALRIGQEPMKAWTVRPRAVAPLPTGFIDQLSIRAQVDLSGTRALVRCRVVAPDMHLLTLGLPKGAILLQATVDGAPVSVRSERDDLLVPLPGRTQVQLALLISGPVPDGSCRLSMPTFGGLHATSSHWQVAVSPDFRVDPVFGSGLQPIAPITFPTARREAFASWRDAVVDTMAAAAPPTNFTVNDDARLLQQSAAPAQPPHGEPTLTLQGQLLEARGGGERADVLLQLEPLTALRAWDRFGRVLAAALALFALKLSRRIRIVSAISAVFLMAALFAAHATCGPLLALAEIYPVALAVVTAANLIRRRLRDALSWTASPRGAI